VPVNVAMNKPHSAPIESRKVTLETDTEIVTTHTIQYAVVMSVNIQELHNTACTTQPVNHLRKRKQRDPTKHRSNLSSENWTRGNSLSFLVLIMVLSKESIETLR